jgi:hypothetical protein
MRVFFNLILLKWKKVKSKKKNFNGRLSQQNLIQDKNANNFYQTLKLLKIFSLNNLKVV